MLSRIAESSGSGFGSYLESSGNASGSGENSGSGKEAVGVVTDNEDDDEASGSGKEYSIEGATEGGISFNFSETTQAVLKGKCK